MNKLELMARGDKLAEKYTDSELREALKDAVAIGDNLERLALQWALKKKTNTKDGYAFTKQAESKLTEKLSV